MGKIFSAGRNHLSDLRLVSHICAMKNSSDFPSNAYICIRISFISFIATEGDLENLGPAVTVSLVFIIAPEGDLENLGPAVTVSLVFIIAPEGDLENLGPAMTVSLVFYENLGNSHGWAKIFQVSLCGYKRKRGICYERKRVICYI